MSLQSNLNSIKESFSKDGSAFENAFRLEILARRYRKYIIAFAVIVIAGLATLAIMSYTESIRTEQTTAAYSKLLENATDEKALADLKKVSVELYELFTYSNARANKDVLQSLLNAKSSIVRTLVGYELTSLKASELLDNNFKLKADSVALIDNVISDLESAKDGILSDYALLQVAYLLFESGKTKEAKEKLMLISNNSFFADQAQTMKHYQGKQ